MERGIHCPVCHFAMNRLAACIDYDGTAYSGWQRQGHTSQTVQEKVETALSKIASAGVVVHCAGRTDSGVHATMQIVHFDTSENRTERQWVRGGNTYLPDDINIKWAKAVDSNFHARFLATSRQYHYVIDNSPQVGSALNRFRATWDYRCLNEERMQQASKCLLGEHDFTSFRAVRCQSKSPVKTVHRLEIKKQGDFIILVIEANAFMHHMVRNIVGVLTSIGAGERDVSWCQEVLQAKDRRVGGVTAPPNGLYLTGVSYPPEYLLPEAKSGIILLS